jgi:hypothetical protein
MAARKEISNVVNLFGGFETHPQRHTMVVVVCKIELVCKISKSAQSRI